MIMVMGTEGFSKAGNNNCDSTREREKEKESERRERERLRRREFRKCWSSGGGAWRRRRTDGRTDGSDGKKYSIFSKLVHFFIFL
jgi:hypothetical protein